MKRSNSLWGTLGFTLVEDSYVPAQDKRYTDDFPRAYEAYKSKGVVFVREPKEEIYDTVAVFKDLYGNLWDLLQPTQGLHGAT